MIQKFIELGEGLGDVYELCELLTTNKHRFHSAFTLTSKVKDQHVVSIAVAFEPSGDSRFMPIYICREGIPTSSKRLAIFENTVEKMGYHKFSLEVKHSSCFAEYVLYYQYLIGVLRLNHIIPPLK